MNILVLGIFSNLQYHFDGLLGAFVRAEAAAFAEVVINLDISVYDPVGADGPAGTTLDAEIMMDDRPQSAPARVALQQDACPAAGTEFQFFHAAREDIIRNNLRLVHNYATSFS
jgi:hypothetical protein